MNVIRRASQTVSSGVSSVASGVSSVASGTTSVVSGTARIIRASTGFGVDKHINLNECDEEFIYRSAKDKVNLQVKCTPGKDAATTGALALKRMFVLKRNEQGQFNRKMICTVPHMFLYYFDNDTAESARGIIDLYFYTSISVEGDQNNILKLSAPEETGLKSFYFQIDDPNTLSELIASLHRDRYNVVRDERDAYQQLQDQFSGEMEGASKQLVLSEQERNSMRTEIADACKTRDEAVEALNAALLKFEVTEGEWSALNTNTAIGEALCEKIESMKSQLALTIEENDKQLSLEREEFREQFQAIESQLLVEQTARKNLELTLVSERRECEFRIRDAVNNVDRLNQNMQLLLDSRDAAEEKATTLTEQKKVLVKEVKLLRKKMESNDEQVESIKALNDQLSAAAELLQQQNRDITQKLESAMQEVRSLKETAHVEKAGKVVVDAANVSMVDQAESLPVGVVVGVEIDVSSLKYNRDAPLSGEDSQTEQHVVQTSSLELSVDSARGHHAENVSGDDLSWLSTAQRQQLLNPSNASSVNTASNRRPSTFAGLFSSHDKHAAKPLLRLSEGDDSEASKDDIPSGLPSTHPTPNTDAVPSLNPHPGAESPLPTYSATYAMMQAMLPVEGKIYCLRCNGTVEGPKYSTCKCKVPALTHDMLAHAEQESSAAGSSISRVGTGVSQVGSSLFGILRRASGVIVSPTQRSQVAAAHATAGAPPIANPAVHSEVGTTTVTADSETNVVSAENDPREPN